MLRGFVEQPYRISESIIEQRTSHPMVQLFSVGAVYGNGSVPFSGFDNKHRRRNHRPPNRTYHKSYVSAVLSWINPGSETAGRHGLVHSLHHPQKETDMIQIAFTMNDSQSF